MRIALALGMIGLTGCAPQLPVVQTASQRYSVLGTREKQVASEFYRFGEGDAIKRLYWSQRNMQQYSRSADPQGSTSPLQHRYVTVPIPEHTDQEGIQKEASNQVIEVVQ